MERIKTLNYYQKGIIIVMVAMILIFAVIYPKTISRVGYRYNDEILVPNQENGNIVYSGKINGVPTQFIVSKEKSIVLQHGDKTYGPYTMKEDPTAIPKDEELAEQMIGVEICNNDKVLFRGGVLDFGDDYWLLNEDGTSKQADLEGGWYEFEKDYFGSAFFEGKTIPCISLKGQRVFHSGYELRDKDKHDISILESLSK